MNIDALMAIERSDKVIGSYDCSPAAVQMAAVHMALITYYRSYKWIEARDGVK